MSVATANPNPADGRRLVRREPPRFRRVEVRRTEELTPRMVRVTLAGDDLDGFTVDQPAASVRLLIPSPGSTGLVQPAWNGNEFLLPDGTRPTIRTFTPRRVDGAALELDIDVVVHGGGAASHWASAARAGAPAAVSGPGRGYAIDEAAAAFLLAGDETAIPAIGQLLEALPGGATVNVVVEAAREARTIGLPGEVEWCDDLVAAVTAAVIPDGARVWVAGEAAAVQRIRKHLFDERGLTRTQATVRGYWKRGRAGDAEGDG